MNAFLKPAITPSKALDRVADAFQQYAPSSALLDEQHAPVVILQVVGRNDRVRAQAAAIRGRGQSYAVIQYAIRSTKTPHTKDWIDFWNAATLVWSYYDLPELCRQDGVKAAFNFYHAPLGVEPVFTAKPKASREFVIGTSGRSWLTESVRECVLAAEAVNKPAWHLGTTHAHPSLEIVNDISDEALAKMYRSSQFVSGLRRVEGFELPAAEGLLCGAIPILFDRPHYRTWYDGLGCEFIAESDRDSVQAALTKLFKRGPKATGKGEKKQAVKRFNWERIIKGFTERLEA